MGLFSKKPKEAHYATIMDNNFQELVLGSDIPVVLDFWAPWCGPCKALGPIVEELAEEFEDRVLIGKVNVDQNPNLSQFFKIKSIPTLIFIKEQRLLEAINGLVSKPNLEEMIEDLIAFDVIKESGEEE